MRSTTTAARGRAGSCELQLWRARSQPPADGFSGCPAAGAVERLETQSHQREQNAAHLTKRLGDIPGIIRLRCTTAARETRTTCTCSVTTRPRLRDSRGHKFLKALRAEGVPASGGYSPLNKEQVLRNTLASRGYKRIYREGLGAGPRATSARSTKAMRRSRLADADNAPRGAQRHGSDCGRGGKGPEARELYGESFIGRLLWRCSASFRAVP